MAEGGIGEYLFDKELHEAYVVKDKGSKPSGVEDVYK